jgi:hypothetical protein
VSVAFKPWHGVTWWHHDLQHDMMDTPTGGVAVGCAYLRLWWTFKSKFYYAILPNTTNKTTRQMTE